MLCSAALKRCLSRKHLESPFFAVLQQHAAVLLRVSSNVTYLCMLCFVFTYRTDHSDPIASVMLLCTVQFATSRQAAAESVRALAQHILTQHTVDVPWEPPAAVPRPPDPRPYAAIARSKPDGAASLPPGANLHESGSHCLLHRLDKAFT